MSDWRSEQVRRSKCAPRRRTQMASGPLDFGIAVLRFKNRLGGLPRGPAAPGCLSAAHPWPREFREL